MASRGGATFDLHEKKPYKVVLESVMKEKKQLSLLVSYSTVPKDGFTFVGIGFPDITAYCKESSRVRGHEVYIVSGGPDNSAHKDPKKISHHIHRLGYHFKNEVVDEAYARFSRQYRAHASSTSTKTHPVFSNLSKKEELQAQQFASISRSRGVPNSSAHHEQLRKTMSTIKELFPFIPEKDLEEVITRAFQEDSGRVGTVSDLTLSRKAQLAVVAHIRHSHTHYDWLLTQLSYPQARSSIEEPTCRTLVRWRGEDTNNVKELEEGFREIIVLDDDDDDYSTKQGAHHEDFQYSYSDEESQHDCDVDSHQNTHAESIPYIDLEPVSPPAMNVRSTGDLEILSVPPRRSYQSANFFNIQEANQSGEQLRYGAHDGLASKFVSEVGLTGSYNATKPSYARKLQMSQASPSNPHHFDQRIITSIERPLAASSGERHIIAVDEPQGVAPQDMMLNLYRDALKMQPELSFSNQVTREAYTSSSYRRHRSPVERTSTNGTSRGRVAEVRNGVQTYSPQCMQSCQRSAGEVIPRRYGPHDRHREFVSPVVRDRSASPRNEHTTLRSFSDDESHTAYTSSAPYLNIGSPSTLGKSQIVVPNAGEEEKRTRSDESRAAANDFSTSFQRFPETLPGLSSLWLSRSQVS